MKRLMMILLMACVIGLMSGMAKAQDFTVGDRMFKITLTSTTEWKSWTATEDLINVKLKPRTTFVASVSTTTDASVYYTMSATNETQVGETSKIERGTILYFNTLSVPGTIEGWGRSFTR